MNRYSHTAVAQQIGKFANKAELFGDLFLSGEIH